MKIIGLTSELDAVHDNSVVLIEDDKILFAEAEERLSRKKHDGSFPALALKEALKSTNNKLSDIDYFVSGVPSYTSFRTILSYLPYIKATGTRNFIKAVYQRVGKARRENNSNEREKNLFDFGISKEKFFRVSHYLAHAATAYFSSPFKECLVVVMDGYGCDSDGKPLSGKIYKGSKGQLIPLEDIPVHGSLGLYYGAVTMALGFKLNDGEGKTMGLAAYGDPKKCYRKMKNIFPRFIDGKWVVKDTVLDILSISWPNIYSETKLAKTLKGLVEEYGRENVAAAAQEVFEEEMESYFRYLVKKYKIRVMATAGGIFLNIKNNMRLLNKRIIDDVFVYPNPSDGGAAAGAAMMGFLLKKGFYPQKEMLQSVFGRSYADSEIEKELKKTDGITYVKLSNDLPKKVAKILADGKVLGWFQGKGEWGPRALGHRSVIADPRSVATKDRINNILKGREWFMPFAPSMMEERAKDYLVNLRKGPFMIIGDEVKKNKRKDLGAVMHIDGTVRPHLVSKEIEPLYYEVIAEFEKLTGVGAILNTSFNKHGLPIVFTPKDAIDHLLWSAIDELVIGSYYVKRTDSKSSR